MVTYRLLGGVSWDNYITTDDGTLTIDTAGDDWEAVIVTQARGELEEDDDDVDDIGDDEPETPVITVRDALLRIKNIERICLFWVQAMHLCLKQQRSCRTSFRDPASGRLPLQSRQPSLTSSRRSEVM